MLTMPLVTEENIVALIEAQLNRYSNKLQRSTMYLEPVNKIQFRFPKSKRVRIRKKWAKNPKNFREVKNYYGEPRWMRELKMDIPLPSFNDFYCFRVGTRMIPPDDYTIIKI